MKTKVNWFVTIAKLLVVWWWVSLLNSFLFSNEERGKNVCSFVLRVSSIGSVSLPMSQIPTNSSEKPRWTDTNIRYLVKTKSLALVFHYQLANLFHLYSLTFSHVFYDYITGRLNQHKITIVVLIFDQGYWYLETLPTTINLPLTVIYRIKVGRRTFFDGLWSYRFVTM